MEVQDAKRGQIYDQKRDTSTTAPPRFNKTGIQPSVKNGR